MECLHVERSDALKRLVIDGKMEARIRAIVDSVLKEAASGTSAMIKGAIRNDPRGAYKAVKHSVWKKALGGSLSILARKKRGGSYSVRPSNRGRSATTTRIMSYSGEDRGFILRFLNGGTKERTVTTMNGRAMKMQSADERNGKRAYKGGLGNRGRIEARNFFGRAAKPELDEAAEKIAELIDQEWDNVFNNKTD